MRNRDCSLGRRSEWGAKARSLAFMAALAATGPIIDSAHAVEATKGRISITLDGLTLTPSIEQKRTEHFEKLQAHLAELAGKDGGEAEALPFLEAEMAYLIQTTPRRADRARALGIVTMAKWYFTMATADQKRLRRILVLQQPFTWSWPLDDLRRQLLEALGARLRREAPLASAREIPYTGELLPSPASMRLCIRSRNLHELFNERLESERTPLADAIVRWVVDRYLSLQEKLTRQRVAELDGKYGVLLARAEKSAGERDLDTARALYVSAQKLRPMRSLAFIAKVVAEIQSGRQLDMSEPESRGASTMLLAVAELDRDEVDVCKARARLLIAAKGVSPAYLERSAQNISRNLANLDSAQADERAKLFGLRASINQRLGRKDKATADRARGGEVEAQLLAALRNKDLTKAGQAFEKMPETNAWRLKDLQTGVQSRTDMVDALRVVNTRGLPDVPAAAPVLDRIRDHLLAFQKQSMISLSGGMFKMGGTLAPDEKPVREVTLNAFAIDRTEVSVGDYERFLTEVKAGRYMPPDEILRVERNFTPRSWKEQLKAPDLPVRWVNWHQASAYATWQGKSLPTEAQWEFAARSTASRMFPWGKTKPSRLALRRRNPLDVGTHEFDKTPEGVMDLGMNVSEWCRDPYDPIFYRRSLSTDPVCTIDSPKRVVRGGSFTMSSPYEVRASRRQSRHAREADRAIGFRCVLR